MAAITSDEIRSTYIEFFEERDHRRLPSASLVPAEHDSSALFTVAGMHPLKPYFLGRERPPYPRVTTCQKTFRTVDIDIIGTTSRHITFFEMLGNFSFGDYFKHAAARFARPVPPVPAGRARSCTLTAASSSASPTISRVATTSGSSSTGTWCSCSSTRTR